MDEWYVSGFAVGFALFLGIGVVGKRYGPKMEKRLDRAAWITIGGACVVVLTASMVWVVFFGEAARERSIERTVATAQPAIDAYRLAADRYVESGCAEGASMSGEPTEAELLCPAGIVLDFRWMAVVDPMVKATVGAPPPCSQRLQVVIGQTNFVYDQIRRAAIKMAGAGRAGEASAALDAMDRAFAQLDAEYASARAACRAPK